MKKMNTYITEKMRDVEKFVNENGIEKDDIISIFQQSDGDFVLTYYSED